MHETITPGGEPFLPGAPEWDHYRAPDMAVSASVTNTEVEHPEALRAAAALYVQQDLHGGTPGDYRHLTTTQSANILTWPTYQEAHQQSHLAMPAEDLYVAGQYVNLAHDVFKRESNLRQVGLDPSESHDEGIRRVFLPAYSEQLATILPSFLDPTVLNDRQRTAVTKVFSAGFDLARFMYMQMSQAEIDRLAQIDPETMGLIVMHGLHDIGGAQGHENPYNSATLDEFTVTRCLDAAAVLLGSPEDFGLQADQPISPTLRSTGYLSLRAARIGLELPVQAHAANLADVVAQVTLASLLRANTVEEFAPIKAAYDRLPMMLKMPWSSNQALPLLLAPDSEALVDTTSMDDAPAFLRALVDSGDSEQAYLALGYFSQVLHEAFALPYRQAVADNVPVPGAPYRVNFYHLARWCAANKEHLGDKIPVIYQQRGRTVTPLPVDPATYKGSARISYLRHPDNFRARGNR